MEVPFFYAPHPLATGETYTLDDDSARHALRVLRLATGDRLILTDGKGLRMETVIVAAGKKQCTVRATAVQETPALIPKTAMGISFTKNVSRIEWFLEKATEIGISEIFPIVCQRTEKIHYKFPRFRQIMISAMLQSQQFRLPGIREPVPVEELIRTNDYAARYIAHCAAGDKTSLLRALSNDRDSLVLVGPEGDFTAGEIRLAEDNRFMAVSLGITRLRTETAGVVACTFLSTIRAPRPGPY